MHKINLLDCTLRDGGYINAWKFGKSAKKHICQLMKEAGIEYLEVGYLKNQECSDEYTLYQNNAQIAETIKPRSENVKYVAMINYGEYPIDNLEERVSESIDAIRVAFSKKDLDEAYSYCKGIKKLGYEVFVQPMGTDKYSDVEFIEAINLFNKLMPRAFYIVDSFGVLEKKDLVRYLSLADNNLDRDIALGYHSHNNLQQAYGNSQYMVEQGFDRELFVDSSIYGMGRGAGNLNTELFARYLNASHKKKYNITSMLEVIDQYVGRLLLEKYWGYSLPYYLSAKHNCHPNYARYFSEKNTLSNKSLNELLSSLTVEEKQSFSNEKAERAYEKFQAMHVDDKEVVEVIKKAIDGRSILILAPGKSLETNKKDVLKYIEQHNPVVMSINVVNNKFSSDFVICTNEKRLRKIEIPVGCKLITTSNLRCDESLVINYSSYLCEHKMIVDNPTLMLLNLLISAGVKRVSIAGFDGYSATAEENYFKEELVLGTSLDIKLQKNKLIKEEMENYVGVLEVEYITPSLYA